MANQTLYGELVAAVAGGKPLIVSFRLHLGQGIEIESFHMKNMSPVKIDPSLSYDFPDGSAFDINGLPTSGAIYERELHIGKGIYEFLNVKEGPRYMMVHGDEEFPHMLRRFLAS